MSALKTQRSIDTDLFDWSNSQPALKYSVCTACATRMFPINVVCMHCGSDQVIIDLLPTQGHLWTYTIQHFMPKEPYASDETVDNFQPFAIGYIELANAIRIESRIPLGTGTELHIAMPMVLDIYCHRTEADGTQIMNYQFKPAL